jgi:SulP family sulfate permease
MATIGTNAGTSWLPRSIECLRGYTLRTFTRDLTAGVTVGVVALPLAMAFAIASGVAPQAGIYTAVIAGFIISALGGSRTQIGGPTGAFVVIVAGIVATFGLNGLAVVGIMAGVILVIFGITGIGNVVTYIPRPVTIGFTNGIAVLIASTQIKDFFGLVTPHSPSAFLPRIAQLITAAPTISIATTTLALLSLAIIVWWPRVTTRIPGSILALIVATAGVAVMHVHLATIGSAFGGIPLGFPRLTLPVFHAGTIVALIPAALTVAVLAAVESLLSAVVADSMSGDRHKSNVELVAQGIANIASPLFGGLPATGAIARTATNIRSGAQTPIAGIVHAITLLVILLVAAPLARFIPLAALAAVLMVVAYNMGEWREIRHILRLSKTDIAVWLTTFVLTVVADLTVAVGCGIALAALLYIYRIGETTTVTAITPHHLIDEHAHALFDKTVPPHVSILRIHGPLLFGTTKKLTDATRDIEAYNHIVILRLRDMTALDATGIHAIEQLYDRLLASGRLLLLCGALPQPARLLAASHFVKRLGAANVLPGIDAALARVDMLAAFTCTSHP